MRKVVVMVCLIIRLQIVIKLCKYSKVAWGGGVMPSGCGLVAVAKLRAKVWPRALAIWRWQLTQTPLCISQQSAFAFVSPYF